MTTDSGEITGNITNENESNTTTSTTKNKAETTKMQIQKPHPKLQKLQNLKQQKQQKLPLEITVQLEIILRQVL